MATATNTQPDEKTTAARSLLAQLNSQRNGLVARMRADSVSLELLDVQIAAIEPHAPKPEPAPEPAKAGTPTK